MRPLAALRPGIGGDAPIVEAEGLHARVLDQAGGGTLRQRGGTWLRASVAAPGQAMKTVAGASLRLSVCRASDLRCSH
jgi:hypothetical protein